MTKETIGEIAVDAVKKETRKYEYLKANIFSNDKTPLWDGEIYVYDNISHKISSETERIPVQVKGKTVKKYHSKKFSFPIAVSELKSYRNDGGVLYFVIQIKDDDNYKIFYAQLLLFDIDTILKGKESRKTINVCFKELLNDKYRNLNLVCLNFLSDRKRQRGKKIFDMTDTKSLNISFSVVADNPFAYMLNNEVYMYAKTENDSYESPVQKVQIEKIAPHCQMNIAIDDKIYYNSFELIRDKTGIEKLQFGNTILLDFKNGKYHYKINGNIDSQINDVEFLIKLIKSGYFSIDGIKKTAVTTEEDKLLLLPKFQNWLQFWYNAKFLFNKLNIDFDINCNMLSNKQINDIQILIDLIVKKRGLTNGFYAHPGIFRTDIDKYKIYTLADKDDEGKFYAYNYFDKEFINPRFMYKIDGKEIISSPFLWLTSQELEWLNAPYTNMNSEIIYDSIISIPYLNDVTDDIISFVLNLLNSYDNSKNDSCLQLSQDIMEHIIHTDDSNINIINLYQIYYRKRQLNDIEKERLYSLKQAESNNDILCAVNILLENQYDSKNHFNKLDEKSKKRFSEYPIYSLMINQQIMPIN